MRVDRLRPHAGHRRSGQRDLLRREQPDHLQLPDRRQPLDPCAAGPPCTAGRAGRAFANCTIADNVPGSYGAAVRLVNSSITVNSSILWNNRPAPDPADRQQRPAHPVQQHRGRVVRYGDHLAGPAVRRERATGPIRTIPRRPRQTDDANAVWIDGDYHLKSKAGRRNVNTPDWHGDNVTSPSIDAGDPRVPAGRRALPRMATSSTRAPTAAPPRPANPTQLNRSTPATLRL